MAERTFIIIFTFYFFLSAATVGVIAVAADKVFVDRLLALNLGFLVASITIALLALVERNPRTFFARMRLRTFPRSRRFDTRGRA